ncbi:MAG: hypothetical protein KIS29_04000 [Thermoplasmata archaeon]|nr:hypothetical protein [Candidatus Sysuiplasma jiujiangense]
MKSGRKVQNHEDSLCLARVESVLMQWCSEVRDEVAEAVSILEDISFEDVWWARQIRGDILSRRGPGAVVSGNNAMDKPETLIEIAFWSGWLKGESETLELALGLVSSLGQKPIRTFEIPGLEKYNFSFTQEVGRPKGRSELVEVEREAGKVRSALESAEFRPEVDMLSISLSSAIDSEYPFSEFTADSTLAELSNYIRSSSPASLAMLSFNCGILAGICMAGKLAGGSGGSGAGE